MAGSFTTEIIGNVFATIGDDHQPQEPWIGAALPIVSYAMVEYTLSLWAEQRNELWKLAAIGSGFVAAVTSTISFTHLYSLAYATPMWLGIDWVAVGVALVPIVIGLSGLIGTTSHQRPVEVPLEVSLEVALEPVKPEPEPVTPVAPVTPVELNSELTATAKTMLANGEPKAAAIRMLIAEGVTDTKAIAEITGSAPSSVRKHRSKLVAS